MVSWIFFLLLFRAPWFSKSFCLNTTVMYYQFLYVESQWSPSVSAVSSNVVSSLSISHVPLLVQPVLSPYMLQNLNFSTPMSTYDIASSLSLSKAAVLTFCPETLTSSSTQPPWHHQSLFAFWPTNFSYIFIQLGICKVTKWEFVVFFFSITFHISFHLTSFAIVLFIQNTSVDLGSVCWDPVHMSPLFDREKLSLPHEFRDTVMFRSCLPYIKI